jgi:predicted outer membrane repeat protein
VLTSSTVWAAGVVGTGSPASCDGNDLQDALNGGGVVTFRCGDSPHTIAANTYVIQDDTTILGDNKITLSGENLRQLFIVNNDVTLTLRDIVLLDGEFSSGGCISVNISGTLITQHVTFRSCRDTSSLLGGGAVYNLGTFNAGDTTFEQNEATNEGGAIFNRGTFNATFATFEANKAGDDAGAIKNLTDGVVIIADSAFVGNTAQNAGGAVENTLSFPDTTGSMLIRRSLFVDNSSVKFGGAINNVVGNLTVENSTFARNISDQGGAIFSENTASTTIKFSTFAANRADTGGAIYRPLSGEVKLGFSILAGSRNESDTADQLECDGPSLTSLGYNLIEDNSCVTGSVATDIRNTPPKVGALQDNGGFSQTQLPDASSPALAKVPAAQCLGHDQRLAKRIGKCDIGAAERGGLFNSAYMARVEKSQKK